MIQKGAKANLCASRHRDPTESIVKSHKFNEIIFKFINHFDACAISYFIDIYAVWIVFSNKLNIFHDIYLCFKTNITNCILFVQQKIYSWKQFFVCNFNTFYRIQCGNCRIQKHKLYCMGCWWPRQNQTLMAALFPKYTGKCYIIILLLAIL